MEILRSALSLELAEWQGFREAKLNSENISPLLTRPPKPDMGDVTIGCFRPAKEQGEKPNELAGKLVEGAKPGKLIASASASGPYVNLTLNRPAVLDFVLGEVEKASAGNEPHDWRYGDSDAGKGKTLVIDLSSPNIAKPLAVHHLRSTMIGYSIKRIRESQGWRVIGINHLGDWGTGFGKLIAGLKREIPEIAKSAQAGDGKPLGKMTVQELNETYARFNKQAQEDKSLATAGREEFAALERYMESEHKGDNDEGAANFHIWQHVRELSLAEFERMYAHLGVSFRLWPAVHDDAAMLSEKPDAFYRAHGIYVGESYYVTAEDLCRKLIEGATKAGVAEVDDGATVIFTHGKKKPPLMLVKSDGATSYHARDMSAALYRRNHWQFDEMTYVVGDEQKLHFNQLFKGLEMLGYDWARSCTHTEFGMLLFQQSDGKWAKTSTRQGTAILLEDLLDEAVAGVRAIIKEKNPELAADETLSERVAHVVGVGAVIFNDLKHGRRNNIKFDWEDVLNFQGETGPYMLYQYVRMGSVLAKYADKYGERESDGSNAARLDRDDEWKIGLLLADFPAKVAKASADFEPSVISKALIELAAATSSWWTNTKDTRIVGDDKELSQARVRLVNAIRKTLGHGLNLLGMQLAERM